MYRDYLLFLYFLECNCDPSGVLPTFAGCGSLPAGELCQCKARVHGRICDECRPLFWNLQARNPEGCECKIKKKILDLFSIFDYMI